MRKQRDEKPEKNPSIKPIAFGERPGPEPYNASEIVAIDDSKFLFCDNNIGDALFELRLAADGKMACPLIRRPIRGIEPGTVDDLEGMTHVRTDGGSLIVAIPSLSLKQRKRRHKKKSKRGKESTARNCLLRISFGEDDRLEAEVLSAFREWIVENAPELGKSPRYLPDDGGLNVEGLGWSPTERGAAVGSAHTRHRGETAHPAGPAQTGGRSVASEQLRDAAARFPCNQGRPGRAGHSNYRVRPFARCMADRRRQFDQCIESPVHPLFVGRQCSRGCPSLRECAVPQKDEGRRRDPCKGRRSRGNCICR